jgi:hypothetical protein
MQRASVMDYEKNCSPASEQATAVVFPSTYFRGLRIRFESSELIGYRAAGDG